jgi:Uri superfamily endonuclease
LVELVPEDSCCLSVEEKEALILRLTAKLHFCASADAAPAAPGAYILQIDLDEPVLVKTASKPRAELPPGRYFYCGSAHGPGGLRSRLARHMRRGKSVHWHIDQLTERGTVTGTWIVCNGRECDLVAMLALLPMPVRGFGSSDCSRCRSHLLYSPTGEIFEELVASSPVLMRK